MTKAQQKKAMKGVIELLRADELIKDLRKLKKAQEAEDVEAFAKLAIKLDHSVHVAWMIIHRFASRYQREQDE